MLILVGSTRPAKVDGAREAVAAIARVDARFADAVFQSHDLTAIAPRMPMSTAEIVDGARRRASALLALASESSPSASSAAHSAGSNRPLRFAIGLEGGVDRMPPPADDWTLQTWAAVSDGTRWGYGSGPSIVLPHAVSERVASGEELGDVIDEVAGVTVRGTRGAWGVLTCDLIGRRDAFRWAVIAAFARFYNGAAWKGALRRDSASRARAQARRRAQGVRALDGARGRRPAHCRARRNGWPPPEAAASEPERTQPARTAEAYNSRYGRCPDPARGMD